MDPLPISKRSVVLGIFLYILVWVCQSPGKIGLWTYPGRSRRHDQRAQDIQTDPTDLRLSELRGDQENFFSSEQAFCAIICEVKSRVIKICRQFWDMTSDIAAALVERGFFGPQAMQAILRRLSFLCFDHTFRQAYDFIPDWPFDFLPKLDNFIRRSIDSKDSLFGGTQQSEKFKHPVAKFRVIVLMPFEWPASMPATPHKARDPPDH